jgi:hypothetical protein
MCAEVEHEWQPQKVAETELAEAYGRRAHRQGNRGVRVGGRAAL